MVTNDKQVLNTQKIQKSSDKNRIRYFFVKIRNYIRDKKNLTKNNLKKFFKPIRNESLKQLTFHAMVYGLIINYTVWIIFHVPFLWYGFPAYGIILYLIKSDFINLWEGLWFKTKQ